MTGRALIDAGPLVAIYSEDDPNHDRCVRALKPFNRPLLTCWSVLAEVAWLLRKQPDGMPRVFEAFAGGLFELASLDANDMPAIAAILRQYENIGLQLADASLAHLAEREGIRTIFTLDRCDFSIIRLKRNRSLRIIPDLG